MSLSYLNNVISGFTQTSTNLSSSLVETLKDMLLMILELTPISSARQSSEQESDQLGSDGLFPYPSLVPVPLHFIVESNKHRLSLLKYRQIPARVSESCDELCVVCLTGLMGSHEVRELVNCRHVFHKECIDAWIDKCNITCPVCRSNLLPGQGEKPGCGEDPWRRERMMYLFGEDCFLDDV